MKKLRVYLVRLAAVTGGSLLGLFLMGCQPQMASAVDTDADEVLTVEDWQSGALKSVIRVNSTVQSYNFIRPWEKAGSASRDGIGVIIGPSQVLVTGEMVADHAYIELEHPVTGQKVPGQVIAVDYEANLALLGPKDGEDASFVAELEPIPLTDEVMVGDELAVWQLEDNGTPAATSATVIRASVGRYFVDGSFFLNYILRGSLQYRVGSFTLPVVKGDKLAGMLLSYSSKEQTSDIIPAPIIESFMQDLEDGAYEGFPNLGLSYANMLDDQLRSYVGVDDQEGGVFVRRVARNGSAEMAGIQEADVILEMGGYAIDSRGNYDHPRYGKLNFSHLVRGGAAVGEVIPVKLVRDGEVMTLDVELHRKLPEDYVVDPYMYDRGPRFLIEGGLVFQELTLPYLKAWGDSWMTRAPFKLVHAHAHQNDYEDMGKEKLVVLTAVVRTPSSVGYEKINNVLVEKVNNQPINSITDLANALKEPIDGIHRIEFDDYPKLIFVDAEVAQSVNEQLGQLGINQLQRLD